MSGCGTDGCGAGHGTPATAGPVSLTLTARPTSPTAAPAAPNWFHLLRTSPPQALLLERSALFEIDQELATLLAADDPAAVAELSHLRGTELTLDELGPLPPPRAISLNVAQSCNLACSYCYADEGRFGGAARRMTAATARRAVDDLMRTAAPGERVLVGFIGGEPLLNRAVVHDTVAYATVAAHSRSVTVGFSVTTNGTLIDAADIELFRRHPFAVTVSVDGGAAVHDRHRRRRDGSGTFHRVREALRPLLDDPGRCDLTARATVTRDDLDIAARVRDLASAGFRAVGVSPARTGPDPADLLRPEDWEGYLRGMVEAAQAEIARLHAEGPAGGWLFSNLGNAMAEIHRGTARPLPCGAAYGYLSVDVDGTYSTCHRTVGDPRFRVGAPGMAADRARLQFLESRLVDRQEPCRSCWARYLCGGGCHAEVVAVGRDNCDMVRGWLEFCLDRYGALRSEFPELFTRRRSPTTTGRASVS